MAAQRLIARHGEADLASRSLLRALGLAEDQNGVIDEQLGEHGVCFLLEPLPNVGDQGLVVDVGTIVQSAIGLLPELLSLQRGHAFELLDEDEDVVLADKVLLALVQKLEVQLVEPWHCPVFRHSDRLEKVGLDHVEIATDWHRRLHLVVVVLKETHEFLGDSPSQFFVEGLLKEASLHAEHVDLFVQRSVRISRVASV